ncbi:prolipoprotein diacylglyceryl transferase [Candidatus Gracilibacteria bacterium]|nr:prolipoprotein diacylglyceryl transferase [Candidatus Gracilibacteria bacterium]
MYPTLEIFGFFIYTFGTILAFSWLLFIVLLHRFAWKKGFTKSIFGSIVPFTLSIFFFGRLFYILSEWVDQKFILIDLLHGNIIDSVKLFFIPEEYFFSLFGGIFGFMLVFLWKTRTIKKDRVRYLDSIIFAFLYSAILGYFGTLLGGQVYGIPFNSPISIVYNHSNTIIKDHIPLFPISVLYMILCAVLAITLRKMSKKILLPDGFIGFMGMGVFSIFIFLGEFLSGSREDMFYDTFYLSLNQIGAIIGIVISILGLINLSSKSK